MRSELDRVALREPPIRHDRPGIRDPERPALLREAVEQERVAPVRPLDRHAAAHPATRPRPRHGRCAHG